MPIQYKGNDVVKRRHESLGHLKFDLDQLAELVQTWENICGSVTISVGDGLVADYVHDLEDANKNEISHLVIQTEQPSVAISLRRHKADISYLPNIQDLTRLSVIRQSLRPYKMHTPYYRLRSFWWLLYLTVAVSLVLVFRSVHHWKDPFWPLFLPLSSMAILLLWFTSSFVQLHKRSSTRIVRSNKPSRQWQLAKTVTYWIFPPIALALGILLGLQFR